MKSPVTIIRYVFWILAAVGLGGGLSFWMLKFSARASDAVASVLWTNEVLPEATIEPVIRPVSKPMVPPPPNGLLMFRGNEARTFYGTGPLPANPQIVWRYPNQPMCGASTASAETKIWCGNGWTGQPVVWERPNGLTEVIFGAYDHQVHFVNAVTGAATRPPFVTGDIIKGSVTLDPDGYPLLYFGSRDNQYRIIALDREAPTELWAMNATVAQGLWNDDWDGNGAIVDGVLYEGSENGLFYVVELNRSYGSDGKVIVAPRELFRVTTFTEALVRAIGDRNVSIENSPVFSNGRVYIANSGGRIMGFDISHVREGVMPVVFDFWAGDDIDATLIVDDEGMLYAALEEERLNPRSKSVGQLIKLNPYHEQMPLVWSLRVPARGKVLGGIWATPALKDGRLYVVTNPGELLVIDAATGRVESRLDLSPHGWSSPAVIDNVLLVGTCAGHLLNYSLENPAEPALLWSLALPSKGCIESTPAVVLK
ncbi:MAG: PQQ-binding-like beta-propeller repeat protein [Candidatus Vogelbacteria bacterium]|nr:PQQ-binding-like beta-propeller repeat protein [Candidatus Vogelbacteria bacterium]